MDKDLLCNKKIVTDLNDIGVKPKNVLGLYDSKRPKLKKVGEL